jgi:hypothetical protein
MPLRTLMESEMEARREELRWMIRELASVRLGPPGPDALNQFLAIEDLPRLRNLVREAVVARSWAELLARK